MIDPNEAKQRGQRLIQIREILGLSRLKFCEKFGFANTTVAQWETLSGVSPGINERHARRVVNAVAGVGLEITETWLLHGHGEPPYLLKPAIKPAQNYFHFDCSKDTLQAVVSSTCLQLGPQYQWFEIPNTLMQPNFNPGDFVIALPVQPAQWHTVLENSACLITLADESRMLRVLREYAPKQYLLLNTNSHTKQSEAICVNPDITHIAQIAIHYRWGQA